MKVRIAQWKDTVSPESAAHGDYEQVGLDYEEITYFPEEMEEIETQIQHVLNSNSYGQVKVDEVAYCDDPDIEYRTGLEYYERVIIAIEEAHNADEYEALKVKIQAIIDRR